MTSGTNIEDGDNQRVNAAIVICTRDRPHDLARALASIIRTNQPCTELIVVDQSEATKTATLVNRYARIDPRIRLISTPTRGLSKSRNIALKASTSPFVIFTDDDCQVTPGWLDVMTAPLIRDNTCAATFGEVRPIHSPNEDGFIVGYRPARARRLHGRFAKLIDGGIGANMGVRRAAALEVGGFDELLGAGGHFPSCEDGDFTYRVLAKSWTVYHVTDSVVLHHGIRDWQSGRFLFRSTYLAIAAAYMKYLRCGDIVGLLLVGQQIGYAMTEITKNVVRLRRPIGIGRVVGLLRGIKCGFELHVERDTLLFVASQSAETRGS